jgi:hypothetical protein
MRLTALAVLFSTGSLALCQSAAPGPGNFQQNWLLAPGSNLAGGDINKLPQGRQFTLQVPNDAKIFSSTTVPHLAADAQIDRQIILHPPLGTIAPQGGIQMAQNLYPGLEFLPIDGTKTGLQSIPITWPEFKIEQIPTAFPKCRITPADAGTSAVNAKK